MGPQPPVEEAPWGPNLRSRRHCVATTSGRVGIVRPQPPVEGRRGATTSGRVPRDLQPLQMLRRAHQSADVSSTWGRRGWAGTSELPATGMSHQRHCGAPAMEKVLLGHPDGSSIVRS